ncbi:MAG: hypothetical protein J7604_10605 [Sporocytophaga sp.]|uniref:hypothetical protein n=1 Tax=Sporocytophaga sp. TaxID=2231183 RepID=UPI001B179303|nr:hypothetical protein [Sporocytophaga sp.]MBO9700649.1 hypothetical protein [Sporocytophaga sp.]
MHKRFVPCVILILSLGLSAKAQKAPRKRENSILIKESKAKGSSNYKQQLAREDTVRNKKIIVESSEDASGDNNYKHQAGKDKAKGRSFSTVIPGSDSKIKSKK